MENNPIFESIQNEINNNNIVIFMKGTADFPQCGFSSMVVSIMRKMNVNFRDINILSSEELRSGIKEFSEWPTIPQVYIKQEFIGGCDILREMYENGDLAKLLRKEDIL